MAVFTINSAELNVVLESMTLSVDNVTSLSFSLWGLNDEEVTIEWGDGTSSSAIIKNTFPSPTFSKSYGTPYTGVITVKAQDLTNITRFISGSKWAYTMTEIANFDGLLILNNSSNTTSTISGNISDLPNTLTNISLYGNTITGNINTKPNIQTFLIQGNNTLSGDIGLMPNTTYFEFSGQNTITGDIGLVNVATTSLNIHGQNTVFGDIVNMPTSVSTLRLSGLNTVTGNINSFNPDAGNMSINVSGQNTIFGDVTTILPTINAFNIGGLNTLTGNLGNMPPSFGFMDLSGPSHNISGTLTNIDYQLTLNGGIGTITGPVDNYQAPNKIDVNGSHSGITLSDFGLIDKTQGKIDFGFQAAGFAGDLTYTAGLWNLGATNKIRISWNSTGNGMSPAEKDQFLIDLNNSNFDKGPSVISMSTNSLPRTSASDAARAQLIADGVLFLGSDL